MPLRKRVDQLPAATGVTGSDFIILSRPSGPNAGTKAVTLTQLGGVLQELGGVTGPQGASVTGPTGPASTVPGPTGPRGNDGVAGAQGDRGPTGPAGDRGADGAAGAPGSPGATGPSGPKGDPGAASTVPGPTGPAGQAGSVGPTGNTGPSGASVTGPQGPAGAAGGQGPTGPTGNAAVIADGNKGDITVSASGATWTINANAVVDADIVSVSASKLTGTIATARLATGTASATTYLRGDQTWSSLPAGGSTNLWIPASAFIPRTTNGAGVDSVETTTNTQNFDQLTFDAATAQFADAAVIMPNNWNAGTVTARFYWTGTSGSGNVVWRLSGRAFGDNVTLDSASGTTQSATDAYQSANVMHVSDATSAITIDGTPAANKPVQFTVSRDAANASDTYSVSSRLLGVEIAYTAS